MITVKGTVHPEIKNVFFCFIFTCSAAMSGHSYIHFEITCWESSAIFHLNKNKTKQNNRCLLLARSKPSTFSFAVEGKKFGRP